jgi:3',5'-nucleoside bisphosphate phosphatase
VPTAPQRPGRHAARTAAIANGSNGAGTSTVDLHTHTLRSDGVLEPEALARAAADCGIRTLAITDHDTLGGYREVVGGGGLPAGLELIPGVEINALARGIPLTEGELHILGFGMDPDDDGFEAALAKQRSARRVRFERTIEKLRAAGMPIDAQIAHVDLTRDDALGRPTIGRALVAAGYAESVEDAFRRIIGWGGPGFVQREGMGPRDAIEVIRSAGGIPVLAHFSEAPTQMPLLRELVDMGLAGLEVHYISWDRAVVELVAAVARALGLIATGGSDYHGDTTTYAESYASLRVPDSVATTLRDAVERAASRTMPGR